MRVLSDHILALSGVESTLPKTIESDTAVMMIYVIWVSLSEKIFRAV